MCICDLTVGKKGYICDIQGNELLAKRLLSLGATYGTEVYIKNYAPLGDPIIISFRGFDLAIRKKDAKYIFVKEA
ncbi:ferrous iron transport protein A [Caloramator quimbayensis]|uniref:Ferrous iron transport protein A n=1 Tax=Caloramator quimbayensis TaxID=1147123 RepID=A0A1T4WNC4_9CLOT|nr:ferrous iron transport protein A [Caloramator quimbayensis]SKA78398.1 ferrous iron transport protein A [Caloramator quimbayensis]